VKIEEALGEVDFSALGILLTVIFGMVSMREVSRRRYLWRGARAAVLASILLYTYHSCGIDPFGVWQSRGNAWRMLGMINSMLDLSRLENGNMPLMREPVVLAELVEQTIHSQSLLAQRREILILNDVPYDLPRVFIDRILISRVLQNLVDNAIKFTAQGSNIEITAKTDPENRAVIVSVHDNGPGIPQELKGMLFQKFITGASPRRGSGLGLAFFF